MENEEDEGDGHDRPPANQILHLSILEKVRKRENGTSFLHNFFSPVVPLTSWINLDSCHVVKRASYRFTSRRGVGHIYRERGRWRGSGTQANAISLEICVFFHPNLLYRWTEDSLFPCMIVRLKSIKNTALGWTGGEYCTCTVIVVSLFADDRIARAQCLSPSVFEG